MIYLASDHRGYQLKKKIAQWLKEWGYEHEDLGPLEYNEDDDYTDFVCKVGECVSQDAQGSRGIVLGYTGQGEAITVNKYKGVRAVVYYGGPKELIMLARQHNDSNVLSLGAGFLDDESAKQTVQLWLETKFPGEMRHVRRINKIKQIEESGKIHE